MKEYNTLNIKQVKSIIYCYLNRPEKRNALSVQLLEELLGFLQEVHTGDLAKVLVIQAEGKVFSAGADLAMMEDTESRKREELLEEAGLFYDCFDTLFRLPIPSIAYAHGAVHGGANGILAACDYALCDQEVRFSFGEVRLGLVPATVAPFIVRRTGLSKAKQWMLGAFPFDSREALDAGLVDRIVSRNDAPDTIAEIATALSGNAPGAISATKKLLLDLVDKPDQELKQFCTGLIAQARMTDEAKEGIRAFFEKREPSWMQPGFDAHPDQIPD